jgi:hypothetical protein
MLIGCQIAMSFMAGGWPALIGLAGSLVALGAIWRSPSRTLAVVGVALGTGLFGAAMWWSVVAPLNAIVSTIVSTGIVPTTRVVDQHAESLARLTRPRRLDAS